MALDHIVRVVHGLTKGALLAALASALSAGTRAQVDPASAAPKVGGLEARAQAIAAIEAANGLVQAGSVQAAELELTAALDRLDLKRSMRGRMLWQRADLRRHQWNMEGAVADLKEAERQLTGLRQERLMMCGVWGVRAELALDQGLLGLASEHHAKERAGADVEQAESTAILPEWLAANIRSAKLWLAKDDDATLERQLTEWLEGPVYSAPALAAEAASLRVRLATGLADFERRDPKRPKEAAQLLRSCMADLPEGRWGGVLRTLTQIALIEGDLEGARSALGQLDVLERGAADYTTLGALRGPLYELALRTRLDRLSGASGEALGKRAEQIDDLLETFQRLWSAMPARSGGRGPLHFGRTRMLLGERLWLSMENGEGAGEALSMLMRVQSLGTLARSLGAENPSLPELRAALLPSPGTRGVLVFLPTLWETHLLLLDSAEVRHVPLVSDDLIDDERDRLLASLMRPRTPQRLQSEAVQCLELGALVFPAEVRSVLEGWSGVTIVGSDMLKELPFEMLRLDQQTEFGAAWAVDRLPSLPVGHALFRRLGEKSTSSGARLVIASELSEAAIALAGSLPKILVEEKDALSLLSSYPDEGQQLLTGPEATSSALFDALAPGNVLQIICHGLYDPRREQPAGLALAALAEGRATLEGQALEDDGILWADEIPTEGAPALVVLTACRAASGPLRRGDPGAADLGGTFLAAGSQAVVYSPFDLELSVVKAISKHLHAALALGESPAEGLRRARRALAKDERFSDPLLRSTLLVIGLGHEPLFVRPPRAGLTAVEAAAFVVPIGVLLALFLTARARQRRLAAEHAG